MLITRFVRRRMWIPQPLRKFSNGSKVDKNHVQSSAKKGTDKKYKVKLNTIYTYMPIAYLSARFETCGECLSRCSPYLLYMYICIYYSIYSLIIYTNIIF